MLTPVTIIVFNKTFRLQVVYILLIIVAVGSFIRFHQLTYASLWLDEIYSMIGSDPATSLQDVYEYSKHDQPPLFFAVLHTWLSGFGYTDFAGRALTACVGVLGIVAMFFLGKEIKNEKLGLLAALITSINWFHVDISKEIRFYPLVFFLVALSYLFFLRSVKRSSVIDFIGYAVFTSMLLNTHYFGMVTFVSQFLILVIILIFYKPGVRLIFSGLLTGAVVGFSLYHWLPVIQHDLQINAFHVSPVKWNVAFDFAWNYIKDPVAFAVYGFCTFLAVRAFRKKIIEKNLTVEHVVVIGWIVFGFMIPLIYSLLKIPLMTPKYNTIIVPGIFLVIANGFLYLQNEKVRSWLILIIFLSAVVVLFFARPPYKPRRMEDWREVAGYFEKNNLNNELIFSQLAWFHQYYFKKNSLATPLDQNDAKNFEALTDLPVKRVWLFENNRYTGGWPTNGFLPEQREKIERDFQVTDTVMFLQTRALLYERRQNIGESVK